MGAMKRPIAVLHVGISIVLLAAGRLSAQAPDPQATQNPATASGQTRIEELERRVRELESRLRELEAANKPLAPPAAPSQPAPAAQTPPALVASAATEESSAASRTGPISGYMDFHLNKP